MKYTKYLVCKYLDCTQEVSTTVLGSQVQSLLGYKHTERQRRGCFEVLTLGNGSETDFVASQ